MAVSAFEKKRVEELFKYFQAASHAIGLADNNVDSENHYDPTLGRVSLDPVLNALCQLGVHRLNCDRAFISLIDHENQYIVSEMTKSVSLYDTSRHWAGDAICMGARPLDLHAGVCAGTMPAFTGGPAPNEHHVNTSNMFADETRYIINDFSLEPQYKDRPYVKGHPHMRYYAEVPIKTTLGYVIGTFAVVDNKPKIGLDEEGFIALNEIATSIMRHIENVKVQDDYAQSSRMLHGLNSLIQDGHRRTTLPGTDIPNGLHPTSNISSCTGSYLSQVKTASENIETVPTPVLGPLRPGSLTSDSSSTTVNQSLQNAASTPRPNITTSDSGDSHQNAPRLTGNMPVEARNQKLNDGETTADLRDFDISDEVRSNLHVAAESLRLAMDLDSVLFLNASPNRMTSRGRASLASSQTAGDSTERLSNGSPTKEAPPCRGSASASALQDATESPSPGIEASATPNAYARLLGASAKTSRIDADYTVPPPQVPETLHQNLLLRYPRGCIFNLGLGELLEDSTTVHPTSDFAERRLRPGHQALSHQEVLDQIHFVFPQAKSVIFLPLWNAAKRSWFAGCLGWSSHEKRVLQREDLAYFNIFGNSLMAKAARLDLIATDHAKSDFISNISHELRSPLHGILGSTELLRELIQDADQQQMIAMVEQCGRTLLDTMNHV
jgi:His Kinase A (phospho-acceptor) domain